MCGFFLLRDLVVDEVKRFCLFFVVSLLFSGLGNGGFEVLNDIV